MTTESSPAAADPLAALTAYVTGLPRQKIILRGVREHRPRTHNNVVTVGPEMFVEVITVKDRQRVVRTFDGVTLADAALATKRAGHTVMERNGNVT